MVAKRKRRPVASLSLSSGAAWFSGRKHGGTGEIADAHHPYRVGHGELSPPLQLAVVRLPALEETVNALYEMRGLETAAQRCRAVRSLFKG